MLTFLLGFEKAQQGFCPLGLPAQLFQFLVLPVLLFGFPSFAVDP